MLIQNEAWGFVGRSALSSLTVLDCAATIARQFVCPAKIAANFFINYGVYV